MNIAGSALFRNLPGATTRIWLFANANWAPNKGAILPVNSLARQLQLRKQTVSNGIRELSAAGLLTLKVPAKRPGTMGAGGKGAAATFQVLGRTPGSRVQRLVQGDVHRSGCWRVDAHALRCLASNLSDTAARILVAVILPCDRDDHGLPFDVLQPAAIDTRAIGQILPDLSKATIARAIEILKKLELIGEIKPAAGSRGARYERKGLALKGRPRRDRRA